MLLVVVAALVVVGGGVAIEPAHADDRTAPPLATWLCAPASRGPFNECWKGNSHDEGDVDRCLARQRTRPQRAPRVRIDDGAWVDYPRTGWRCVALPVDHAPRITVENHGAPYASWRLRAGDRRCASGVLDLRGPNFYGAVYATCSRRAHLDRDDRVPAPASAPPAARAPAPRP